MSQIPWSEERVSELRKCFDENRSVSIMSKLFGISRGAVIGKLHRLGLRREKPAPCQKTAEEILAAQERRRVMHNISQNKRRNARSGLDEQSLQPRRAAAPSSLEAPPDYAPLGIPFADLEPFSQKKPNQCRYMDADEPGPEFRCCGIETAIGKSWCAHCSAIVHDYRKPTDAELARARNLSVLMKTRHAMRSGV
jgi:hypothetical protein